MVAWFDSVILNWFQSIQNEFLTVLFKAITFLGEGGLIWIALGLCLIAYKNVSWPQGGMDLLHEYGFKTVAMALRNDSVRIDDEKLHEEEKLAIILGTEGDGLAAETMARLDFSAE